LTTSAAKLTIGDGSANATLGFTAGAVAGQRLPTAAEIAVVLNANATFNVRALASASVIPGMGTYLQIMSLSLGVTSSIAFGAGSAFHDTNLGITSGVSGDTGEAAGTIFTVTSNRADGSGTGTGPTGIPGQTYTDTVTGLRFTVLPSTTGAYTPGHFHLVISDEIKTNSSIPVKAVPGLEMTVLNTLNVPVGDSALVTTFNKSGNEPAIGDYYYLSYDYTKEDFSTQMFTKDQMVDIEALYGAVSVENRLSLAASVAFANGAPYIGLKQVLKVAGEGQASDASFITAINELTQPLVNSTKPYAIVPLTTSTAVISSLEQHVAVQSSPRYGARRIGFYGNASGTKPTTAQAMAKSIKNTRIRAVYPDAAVIGITNELGEETEQIVDGSFLAVALGASIFSPAIDFATPYTNRVLKGFKRLVRRLDTPTQSQTAISGINVLEDSPTGLVVKQGFTTDMSDLLSQLPTVTQIDDVVQENVTLALNKYVGVKYLDNLPSDVAGSATGALRNLKDQVIIKGYKPAVATPDANDPTLIRCDYYYAPILPNLYILATQYVRVRV
jgi:hypothetical protein